MSELLPTVQAANIRHSLVDYLTTTFALTDPGARDALDRFLADPESGMFKGPYVRLRLPFRPAADGWRDTLEWYEGHRPYGHQAAAFARLSSLTNDRPQPTLVTTGTGSGKTEAFLHPIVDHVLRARREGITGTKALILYPMNALANDQAKRLTQLLTTHPELGGITAALYTGQEGKPRTMVTADGLITDRGIIRDSAPDILLTNYKMLDQLLLRAADQDIWRQSARSLQYLVLDEFHTYDGAQGTDVAMLLRRLGIALKSFWPKHDATITPADRARPLGRITPVATSATLGDKGDSDVMLDFARTVFGEEFGPDAVVTESRLSVDEWSGAATDGTIAAASIDVVTANAASAALGSDPAPHDLTRVVLDALYPDGGTTLDDAERWPDLFRRHPLVAALAEHANEARGLGELVARVLGPTATPQLAATGADPAWERFLSDVVAALGHVRTLAGRSALSVEAHLWVRELTRIDRDADPGARFRWGDDGPATAAGGTDDVRGAFPAIYCRRCGRSGWGVGLAPVGTSLAVSDDGIRRDHAHREGRFRALLHAGATADAVYAGAPVPPGLVWFSVRTRELLTAAPAEDDPDLREGWLLPVLTTTGADADDDARSDTCPACGQADGIRFLGSAIATLLSVSLSTLFGSHQLSAAEKKALVFTDSVQDAAHRAGFVQSRSHTLTLRAVLRSVVQDGPLALEELVEEILREAGNDPVLRYRLLPPDCADRPSFTPFWTSTTQRGAPQSVRSRVRKRLALDAALEFGLSSRLGRTLELTGSVAVEVDAGEPDRMAAAARTALASTAHQTSTTQSDGEHTDATLIQWVRGVLDRMRAQGAIDHTWFDKYRKEDGNRWWVTGGRARHDGMPSFPGNKPGRPGRPAPGYPRVGGSDTDRADGLEPVTSARTWYAQWTSRTLGVSPHDGGRLARLLLDALARDGVLTTLSSTSGATVYAIPAAGVVVAPTDDADLTEGRHLLECDTCRDRIPGTRRTVSQLTGAPCMLVRCPGRLTPAAMSAENFYRRLYASPDMRRVVAREHTSLLDDETRLAYENGFKGSDTHPDSPNVLVATPTLEMGIDIGDLSAVFLSSLPRTVAAYLQRVGRAGRLTGNALDLAYLTGRGEQLPKLGDPLSVINGEVRPPATYLRAEEILRRQFTAHLADEFARDTARPHPRKAAGAIGSTEPGSYLGDLVTHAETHAEAHATRFLDTFIDLPGGVADDLRAWTAAPDGPGTSAFAQHVGAASRRWRDTVEELKHREDGIDKVLPELQAKADSSAATDDDKRALRSAETARKLTSGQLAHLRGEYWIGVLEEYGLLPNYTLLDDSVTLDVGLSWTNPDTGKFQTSHERLQRGSAQAIREFAPGNRFYARGLEIAIDAVDLGVDRVAIRPWVFCPACGYAVDIGATGTEQHPASCPRCGSTGIGDTGQRLDVVELTHVTAEVRRDEAIISDRTEQRDSRNFAVVTAADVDPDQIEKRWFVESVGFGATFVRALDLRWINVGLPGHGSDRTIAGGEISGALFRVCAGCGKLDTDTGRNRPHEHRPWCRYRTAVTENTTTVALSRTLRTQGLLLRLPNSVTIGDDFAVPSLAAAVLLGLREQLGGHPDHIRIEQVVDPTPSDGSENHQAVLLHDAVPGGTGYLADLADPEQLRSLLLTAWERVRDCECQTESRRACHRCLLPFVAPRQVPRASRASAERHLRTLLAVDPDGSPGGWTITDTAPPDTSESHLEQRFRKVIVDRLRTAGATLTEIPGAYGNTVRIHPVGQHRQWTLTPQVNVENSRPDFLLSTDDTGIPDVAIFTDGRIFHATVGHNRLADDAEKRRILRDTGRVVLAVTADDVGAAEQGTAVAPSWYSAKLVQKFLRHPSFMAATSDYERLTRGPVDWLLAWITDPRPDRTTTVARAVPAMVQGPSTVLADDAPLASAAHAHLLGLASPETGSRTVHVWHSGACALAVEPVGQSLRAALVLDDRDAVLDAGHADAWREWLRLSNALALRDWPTVITTTSLVRQEQTSTASDTGPALSADIPAEWQSVLDETASQSERALVLTLAQANLPLRPTIGDEGPDGIPLDVAWPSHKVVARTADMSEQDRDDLTAAGWQVVDPTVDAITAALSGAGTEGTA